MNAYQSKRRTDEIAIYVFGKIEQWIEDYAKSNNLPANELAERVAGLLYSQTGREILGTSNRVPTLRGNSTGFNQPLESLEMARGPYSGAQVRGRPRNNPSRFSDIGRAKIVDAQKRRWAKFQEQKHAKANSSTMRGYWAKMTPEQRSKEMIRRRQVTLGKVAKRRAKKSSPSPEARERKRARDRAYYYAAKHKSAATAS